MDKTEYKKTTVNSYFAWLEKTISPDTLLHQAAHDYLAAESGRDVESNDVFLSIVMRTQGKRPEMLSEALLSLTAQSNTDFELLVMGHNLTNEQSVVVNTILSELPDWMRAKTQLIPVNGGTRTTPLNRGFEAAKGKYIAVLDDDDLVFDNWVEVFHELSEEHDGKILHAYSVIQDWEVVGGDYPDTPRAADSPKNTYCRDFNLMDELTANFCPLCTLAFPAYAFQEWGIHFDETLTTTEDWDFTMRTAFLTGVADSSEITFLYRHWLNAESSATVHKKKEWDANYCRIVKQYVKTPFVLPSNTLHGVIDRHLDALGSGADGDNGSNSESSNFFLLASQEVFYDDGSGFEESKRMVRVDCPENSDYNFCFKPMKELCENVEAIRFDPVQRGFASVKNLKIRVVCEDNSVQDFDIGDVDTNGCVHEDKVLFLKSDPQIVVYLSHPANVKQVLIKSYIIDWLEDQEIEIAVKHEAIRKNVVRRLLKKSLRLIKKYLHKCRR